MKPIETEDLTIRFDAKTCIHARRCVLGLPGVFDPNARPWIQPGNTPTEDIVAVIEACPSGALSYERKTGAGEAPPKTNTAKVWENGPIELHGDIRIEGQEPRLRAVICRCGRTSNPPFCDNSHHDGFAATGLPGFKKEKDTEIEASDGPLKVSAARNGSVSITGNMEVIAADGSRIARTGKAWLCRCGASGNKPFCDGSHGKIGFTKPASASEDS
jgi:CDGSH-type Zn-finger protein/uncharacterized Fe-S cluster protein YjdI